QSKCGSGLAREYAGSATDTLTDTPISRASPLPQVCDVVSVVQQPPARRSHKNSTSASQEEIADTFLANLERYMQGSELANLVDL
ncbi:hypothetical protein ACU689_30065, partial [Pseudomonas sp. LF090]